ncbi:DNA-binding transcriptional LysR family regulator [Rhodobacter aestuarii]|uniref:DNA-binding transcriptional regulator, LysR family n=1 Tax=Rhodobacter aestuarii TaxID=453582 RepID=A0A1N7P8U3_9RHOB|nr:LysR family transcriptional regulator [Rhodobacter aestuarii]PTV97664.1 DNA-binding transcriptional LysR family regulator [Rhodobacter aestuarii]SIT06970.1 DNA-binding transcriptional regulator, LysR family [Rhodobacter aestuarii]
MSGRGDKISLWAVEMLVATAEERAITAAARRLGVSPSSVSQQIAALEAALGAELVDRTARPFGLTAAGQAFLPHAEAMLDELAKGRAGVGLADPAGLRSFRLGMIEDFEAEVTPLLLAGMGAELTACRFLLETGPSHRLAAQLEARALDMVVAAESDGPTEGLERHALLTEPFIAVWPEGQVGADLPLLHYSPRTVMGRQIAAHLARTGAQPTHRFEIDSYPAILALVAAGQGWSILTPSGVRHGKRAGVTLAALPGDGLARRIQLTARAGVMGELPGAVAARLRGLLAERIVAPMLEEAPWLAGALRVEG